MSQTSQNTKPNHKQSPPSSSLVSPVIQFTLIAITITVIILSLVNRLSQFSTRDAIEGVHIMTPKTLRKLGGSPNPITVGLYITHFKDFDMLSNLFTFSGVAWFLVQPDVISVSTLGQFEIDRGTIKQISEPEVRLYPDRVLVKYDIEAEVMNLANFADFPVDDHRLFITLLNKLISPSEFIFESTNREIIIEQDVRAAGWKYRGAEVETGYLEIDLDPHDPTKSSRYPAVTFILDYQRYGIRYVISILMPLLLIFCLSMFAFSLEFARAIIMAISGITAMITYRFVIENLSPKVGYFMTSDYIFLLFLIACTVIFLFVVIDQYAIRFPPGFKVGTVIGLYTLVAAVSAYLFTL